ncbi:MAG TPA: SMC-Scp complex subunit ScpB, partial [Phycisphaerae bacterium]|nr:SMC-Scp complex subunit ScpB [Phycisphaerae bacterium]
AILMAADTQLPAAKIATIMGQGSARSVRECIETLNEQYEAAGASFRIEEIAGGYQILTRPEFNSWLTKLLRVRQETKLSGAAMETLSVIAYKQPCTRAEIEAVRGVAAGDMVNKLRELNLVKIVGRAEDLGRPILYGTTKRFLEAFGLPSLEDLPQVEALKLAPAATEATTTPTSNQAADEIFPAANESGE